MPPERTGGFGIEALCEGEFDVYEPGLEVRSQQGNFFVELVESVPAPPAVGVNDWVIRVTTESGSPVSGSAVVVEPRMSIGGMGLDPATYSGVEGADGTFAIPPFTLDTPGLWDVEVLVAESMMNDVARFRFCIGEGALE